MKSVDDASMSSSRMRADEEAEAIHAPGLPALAVAAALVVARARVDAAAGDGSSAAGGGAAGAGRAAGALLAAACCSSLSSGSESRLALLRESIMTLVMFE